MDEDKITMSPEAHQARVSEKIWPAVRGEIDKAVAAGRPIKITAERPSEVSPKEEPPVKGARLDGKAHVVQSKMIRYTILIDAGREEVS